ncbi:MAG: hypothetical protein ACW99Q_17250 [Candidatus Kariarchaeaceae archaeon]
MPNDDDERNESKIYDDANYVYYNDWSINLYNLHSVILISWGFTSKIGCISMKMPSQVTDPLGLTEPEHQLKGYLAIIMNFI